MIIDRRLEWQESATHDNRGTDIMGLITNVIAKVAANVVEDAADNLVVSALVGAGTAVVGAAEGIIKGAEVVGGAVGTAKQTVGSAVNNARDNVGIIIDGAKDTTEKVLTATVGDKDTRHYKKERRYLATNSDSPCLIIQKTDVGQALFSIYDPDEQARSYVQGKLSSNNMQLSLLDTDHIPVGTVKKTILALRTPVFHESKPANYSIDIDGQYVATLKTKLSANKENYEIEPFGWMIKGSVFKWDFTVLDGEKEIVHISKRKGYDSPTYIIDFQHEENEIIGLLVVLTLICREN